jgi:hypothetical protein
MLCAWAGWFQATKEKGAGGGVGAAQAGSGTQWGERFEKRRGRDRGWGSALMFESRCCPGRSAVLVALLSESLCCPSRSVVRVLQCLSSDGECRRDGRGPSQRDAKKGGIVLT